MWSRGNLRNKALLISTIGLMALALAACAEKMAQESTSPSGSGTSLTSAAAVGSPVSAIVELSDIYRAPETYDVKITVLEILRGKSSTDLLTRVSASNAPAPSGFEYVLARIRFEYAARGAPGDKPWELNSGQFSAFSRDGKPYATPSIVYPEPKLIGALRAGDSQEGWLVFAVAIEDRKPVMIFGPASIWFRLY